MQESQEVVVETSQKVHRLQHRLYYIVAALLVLILGLPAVVIMTWQSSNSPFPQFKRDDIATVRLTQMNDRGGLLRVSPLDRRFVDEIFDALEPNYVDKHPLKWLIIGALDVELTNGLHCSIELYCTGDDEGAFSIDSTYYRGGSDRRLMAALHRANPSWKFQGAEEVIKESKGGHH
jgi:hypothetical protein